MSLFVLLAGGTAGHLFPAAALGEELARRGHRVQLMTDARAAAYGADFPAEATHIIPSATPSVRNPLKFLAAGATLLWGTAIAALRLRAIRPDAVVGFGGYPVVPPFFAAALLRVPSLLHEQNAVMGRANQLLARVASKIALSFNKTVYSDNFIEKTIIVGNPVRDRVRFGARAAYEAPAATGPIRLVVFGGSQGARALSEFVPPAIALLPERFRRRIEIVQQCRPEDLEPVAETYRRAQINVELAPFFADLPERMAASHLIIARAGASSVTELTVLGRPSILVPLPGALDGDQAQNARFIAEAGGGWAMEQAKMSPPVLAAHLAGLFDEPARLAAAAAAAKSLGVARAAEKLADLAEALVSGKMSQ